MKLMVHIYTTGPNGTCSYRRIGDWRICVIGVLSIVPIGGNWPIGVLAILLYYN